MNTAAGEQPARRPTIIAAGVVLALAVVACYANTLRVPFLFDDAPAIERNTSIRSLGTAWFPSRDGSPVTGRPLLNVSLALNHAVGGLDVRGFHLGNIAIHAGAVLLLFGFTRRTLMLANTAPHRESVQRGSDNSVRKPHATALAFALALWWGVHPLQTAAVTYLAQRAESLAGLLILLSLYAFARGATSDSTRRYWQPVAIVAAVLAVSAKETAVVIPVLALVWDRTFVSATFAAAWRRHRLTYVGLLVSWIVLAVLVAGTGSRGGSAGFASGIPPFDYALTQVGAILHYLRLAVWPAPLVFDYGTPVVDSFASAAAPVLTMAALLAGTIGLLRFRPAWGFMAAWFFALLAPSSSIVPVATQTIAEHRMYLALAAVLAGAVVVFARWMPRFAWWSVVALVALGLGLATVRRNTDFATAETIWRDTARQRPTNARAHHNLAQALMAAGQPAEAIPSFRRALELEPEHVKAHDGLGAALLATSDLAGALQHASTAVRLDPHFVAGRINLGAALARAGRSDEALAQFQTAVREDPLAGDAHLNLGLLLLSRDDVRAALPHLVEAVRQLPPAASPLFALAHARAENGDIEGAIAAYHQGLALAPDHAEAHHRLGLLLAGLDRAVEALPQLEAAARLQPGRADVRANLGNVALQLGRIEPAIGHYETALQLDPTLPGVRENLTLARRLLSHPNP